VAFIQNVRYFDARILTLDTPTPSVISLGKEKPAGRYVREMENQRRAPVLHQRRDEAQAQTRISQTVNATLREE